ncbi:MAG TPA: hypothetical protein VM070_01255 [Candidatus Saccharimonadales bacterium]|nr:hypothetical protein [Candidatus Saccharimonadales bacterium]
MQASEDRSGPRNRTGGRGILGGAVLLAVGLAVLLPPLGVRDAGAFLFLFLGTAFAVAYRLGTRPYVYLVPAAVLSTFGLGLLLPGWLGQDAVAKPIFLASLAVGLLLVFVLAPARRLPLVPSALLAVVALAELFGRIHLVPVAAQPFFVPLILIVVGAYLLIEPRTH